MFTSVILSLAATPIAYATESLSSHYMPGAYNDFFMNVQVDPGVYFRDDLTYYSANISAGVEHEFNVANRFKGEIGMV
jgi:hypothetical protein